MAFVQQNVTDSFTSSTSSTCSQGSNTTSGNLLIVSLSTQPGIGVSSVADTVGTAYSKIVDDSAIHTPFASAIYAGSAAASGANTITVTCSSASNFFNIWVYEFSGTTTTTDGSSFNNAPETAITSGSIITGNANDVLFGYHIADDDITAGEASWTSVIDPGNGGLLAQYRIVSATGTYSSTATTSVTTGNCPSFIAAFKLSSTTNVNGTFSGTGKASGTFKAFILKDAVLSI